MSVNHYPKGSVVIMRVEFRLGGTTLADPSSVALTVAAPSGQTVYTYGVGPVVVRDSVGKFHAEVDVDEAGGWRYVWASEGAGKAASPPMSFRVEAGL